MSRALLCCGGRGFFEPRVLCVEPNKEIARSVRELLTHDGYQVVMVATPDEALDVLRSETPHAVLAEAEGAAGSGGPSGRELCTLIKRTHRLQHIPVILLTNSALPSDYSASRRAGAMLCVPMPCDPERLQRAVIWWLLLRESVRHTARVQRVALRVFLVTIPDNNSGRQFQAKIPQRKRAPHVAAPFVT